ncbi:TPA: hypothetical protein N0F65_002368 [Lagenidium giganteum]|uniref:Uncharacterized protein n=1 Tax=Lagenidium giganteum TaxID=4803 RepID=A0AAV2YP67_9STRA|nr:TPA: hypothetical protein N0F65_002368 [Lagenidium giganteum]
MATGNNNPSNHLLQAKMHANGVEPTGSWTHELNDVNMCSGPFMKFTWCPCFPLAQLEARLGINTYGCALASFFLTVATTYFAFIALMFIMILNLVAANYGPVRDDPTPPSSGFGTLFLAVFCTLLNIAWYANRIASIRTQVRIRFQIPGSAKSDLCVAWTNTGRAIYQMARQLNCENESMCSRPPADTLAAYP